MLSDTTTTCPSETTTTTTTTTTCPSEEELSSSIQKKEKNASSSSSSSSSSSTLKKNKNNKNNNNNDGRNHLKIVSSKLSSLEYLCHEVVADPRAGAISTFSGVTRNEFEGKDVLHLEYECYIPMALSVLSELCETIRSKWNDILHIAIEHRIGLVPVKETSVIIAISSAHRKDGLEAVHWAIDNLKANVPIWKKETYISDDDNNNNNNNNNNGCDNFFDVIQKQQRNNNNEEDVVKINLDGNTTTTTTTTTTTDISSITQGESISIWKENTEWNTLLNDNNNIKEQGQLKSLSTLKVD